MESALKLSASLAQPFGVGDAIKFWFGSFNLFLETNQIVIAYNLYAPAFSETATSWELFRYQLQLITYSRSNSLSSVTEMNNLPFSHQRAYSNSNFDRYWLYILFWENSVIYLPSSIKTSTSVSNLNKFPARKPFKSSNRNSCQIVIKEIPILAWPTPYFKAYNLYQLSSFDKNGCKFRKSSYVWTDERINFQRSSLTLSGYFKHFLFHFVLHFCRTRLNCCSSCGIKSHFICSDKCLTCVSSDQFF